MDENQKGFSVVEAIIIIFVLGLIIAIGGFAYTRISTQSSVADDAVTSENLEKTRSKLVSYVTEFKTIPRDLITEEAVSYRRIDNQNAELCASFAVPRSGKDDTILGPIDGFKKYFGASSKTHKVYRDDVDFYQHSTGRNCYQISYAPINSAYEDRFKDSKKNWKVCDSLRQYDGRYTGQTIGGFVIGGPLTVGASDGRNLVLADDIDAYDENCVKIPVSDLNVGDKAEIYIETFEHTSTEFVKAIKKVQ